MKDQCFVRRVALVVLLCGALVSLPARAAVKPAGSSVDVTPDGDAQGVTVATEGSTITYTATCSCGNGHDLVLSTAPLGLTITGAVTDGTRTWTGQLDGAGGNYGMSAVCAAGHGQDSATLRVRPYIAITGGVAVVNGNPYAVATANLTITVRPAGGVLTNPAIGGWNEPGSWAVAVPPAVAGAGPYTLNAVYNYLPSPYAGAAIGTSCIVSATYTRLGVDNSATFNVTLGGGN